ncbi:beta-ketoacyl synthase N-terminal-like domain-containing protein [Kitasatospora sp. NPDC049285]|uniref:beta-ketoacyl synthase N-terminal-like domain-containing protein n=1 Tax=Kitasatospora sp. NPDC049285 TaxID=3157096 RepID=UPI00343FD792
MTFEPIAIVGRGCVLPDAFAPQTLWQNVADGRRSLSAAPAGRWGLPRTSVLGATAEDSADRTWHDVGGYVHGFDEVFDPDGFQLAPSDVLALDPLVRWVLHAAREALREAGDVAGRAHAGLVMGNLSYPSAGLSRFAESVWLDGAPDSLRRALPARAIGRPDPRNRFSSGLPAHLAARALDLRAGAFALDAACASSLYAVKLACDRLHDRSADLMLAGAVNCPDDLFIHMGFSALAALSRTGRSRPFHREADGLVPAEGAGFVALMRLADALSAGTRILGVVRGVGLSNDGRTGGLLVPAQAGQERAMRLAYAGAGVAPETVSLVECHATGTQVGDATEAASMARVFGDAVDLPIGSAKSNLGHLITTAGIAGLFKVLGAMEAGIRPATLDADEPINGLAGTPLRLLRANEDWPGLRRAAVSAFGFGGNNAHLVVDAWPEPATAALPLPPALDLPVAGVLPADVTPAPVPVAVVAVAVRAGTGRDTDDFRRDLFGAGPVQRSAATVGLQLDGLRFPPHDLGSALPQQLLLLETAREATADLTLPRERTGVLVGMGCDAGAARYGARWRSAAWLEDSDIGAEDRGRLADAFQGPLTSAGVVGTMPNIVANRLNAQLDLAGPSFTVSAEEASGTVALELAARALRADELDAAVVGAVDLSDEPVHLAALAALGREEDAGDAAVVLVLKRLEDARRDGDRVLALLGGNSEPVGLTVGDRHGTEASVGPAADDAGMPYVDPAAHFDPAARFGSPHAARGLLAVAVAVLALHHRAVPRHGAPAMPALGAMSAAAVVAPLEAPSTEVRLGSADCEPWLEEEPPQIHVYSGADGPGVAAALAAGRESDTGPARLVIVSDRAGFATRAEAAGRWLATGGPRPEGVTFRPTPLGGEVAFVFSGGSMAYPGMGRELMLAFPGELARIGDRFGGLHPLLNWARGGCEPEQPRVLDQIWGSSLVGQLHAEITTGLLGISPQAVLGYSSGESTALSALGLWTDGGAMVREAEASSLFTDQLVGDHRVMRDDWRAIGVEGERWVSHLVNAPVDEVRAALAVESAAHLITVNSPDSCVIGGEEGSCSRVLERLVPAPSLPVPYDIAVHVPGLAAVERQWWELHHRPVNALPGVRFYTAATGAWYHPSSESAADALTAMGLNTVDFPRVVRNAWKDGVRIFIEHGPRGLCTTWIRQTLGEREHLAVALDLSDGKDVQRLFQVAAELICAGVAVDVARLTGHFPSAAPKPTGWQISLPAHPPVPRLPDAGPQAQIMDRAPWVPPVPPSEPVALRSAPTGETTQIRAPRPAPAGSVAAEVSAIAAATATADRAKAGRLGEGLPTLSLSPDAPAPVSRAAAEIALPAEPIGYPTVGHNPYPVAAAYAACYRQASDTHRSFLLVQSQAHREFLRIREMVRTQFLQAASRVAAPVRSAPAGASLPASPPPPRSQPAPVVPAPLPAAAQSPTVESPVAESPPAARPAAPLPAPSQTRPGPSFDRRQLEQLASGRISELFGPDFAAQDGYRRQTRMPRPPMLLADRVTGIDAVPTSMGTGTIWTETDVELDSWYLDPTGRMPAGIMVEAGQADLLLISWLGADLLNRGERVYRLLGCELTYHGSLPVPGETLRFEIRIDGHGEHDGVRIFFFHYDCYVDGELRLSARDGQAGFFTDAELAATRGVLWDPAAEIAPAAVVDPPAIRTDHRSFGPARVRALAAGRPYDCFGVGWEATRSHIRSPQLGEGRMLFLDEVSAFEPDGGPWGRGYLRAERRVSPDDWYFEGHFKNDPCMPGTLMFEGCLQAMAFHLAALGFTAERDGWRFEPVPEEPYAMRCRGQITPESRDLSYEVFVTKVSAGPTPTLFADVLCTVDGVKAFHARGLGVRLVPDWPLTHWKQLSGPAEQSTGLPVPARELAGLRGQVETSTVAAVDGFPFDRHSLLAAAWGRPSEAFGPMHEVFDSHRRVARLPGPPYHFMSRISAVHGPQNGMQEGSWVEAEYDVPDEVWYREQNASGAMPLAVLLEVALQPCGWLASYVGSALRVETDVLFRNLDGTGTMHAEVLPGTRTLRTRAEVTHIAQSDGMIIETFEVRCTADGAPVFTASTVFGYFPPDAFENQAGLPPVDDERSHPEESSWHVDLTARPARYCEGPLRLAGPMLLMLDRVVGYWPEGGQAGLGRLRAEKDVDPQEWYFKAHFFQDPVQPGSLGLEAMAQLLQFHMIERGLGTGLRNPRFEAVGTGSTLNWKYRGQVVPSDRRITVEMEIVRSGVDEVGPFAVADAWLWVDGRRIYRVDGLAMRIVEDASEPVGQSVPGSLGSEGAALALDPAVDGWLLDHCPTWSVPTLPMMSTVDLLATAAAEHTGLPVTGLRDVRLYRWIPLAEPVTVRCEVAPGTDLHEGEVAVTLLAWRRARTATLSRFEPVARGIVRTGPGRSDPPPVLAPPADAVPVPDPYAEGALMHGPAFQYLTSLRIGAAGSSAMLEAGRGGVPRGLLHQGLLDAATHGIPHDRLSQWSEEIPDGTVAYPHRLARLDVFEPLPQEGEVAVEVRFAGFDDGDRTLPVFDIQIAHGGRTAVTMRLVEILLPQGPLGRAGRPQRMAFLRDHRYAEGLGLSTTRDDVTRLTADDVESCDWLHSTVAHAYGLPDGAKGVDHLAEIAVRDHVARLCGLHPTQVEVGERLDAAYPATRPDEIHYVHVVQDEGVVVVRSRRAD